MAAKLPVPLPHSKWPPEECVGELETLRSHLCFWAGSVPVRQLLKLVRNPQQLAFVEGRCLELQTDGQLAGCQTAGDRDAWQAREVGADGVDVAEVHGQRIVEFFSEAKGGSRGDRASDDVHSLECFRKIVRDAAADFECFQVVGIVVSGGQRVRAEHDAALDFGTESLTATLAVEIDQVIELFRSMSVMNAVEAGEITGRFAAGDQVVRRDGVL